MIIKKLISAFVGISCMLAVELASAGWIDWTSHTTGTMDVGGTTVGVTLSGGHFDYVNGDHFYNNAHTGYTSPTGTYGGLAPFDLIRVNYASPFTLTFDQTVSGLNMALVSVGRGGLPVTYDFSSSFTVESFGSNYWGYGSYGVSGDDFTGREFNGILRFEGEFDAFSFSTDRHEFWHGFNFGSDNTPYRVFEPSQVLLLSLGLIGLMLSRRAQAKASIAYM